MVWGEISLTARTDLVVVDNGAVNADRYMRNILEEHVVPFASYIGENFIFMDDNARPHSPLIVQEYLEEVEVSRREGPAKSPDLNPIQQVWDKLNRKLRSSENHPVTLNDLGIQLQIWEGLDQNILGSLILSRIGCSIKYGHSKFCSLISQTERNRSKWSHTTSKILIGSLIRNFVTIELTKPLKIRSEYSGKKPLYFHNKISDYSDI